jgi:type I restriction enzyme S subunit
MKPPKNDHPTRPVASPPWFDAIPAYWQVQPLKSALARSDAGVWGEDPSGGGTPVLRSTDITSDGKWNLTDPAYRDLTEAERLGTALREGDLLMTKSSGSALHLGKTALVTSEVERLGCCFSNFMQRLRARDNVDPRYLYWFLNSGIAREQFNYYGTTTTGLANLSAGLIGSLNLALPPPAEQSAIAEYLAREVELIDALIQAKLVLVATLHEKRCSVINHSVTRGCEPGVALAESEIPWLSQIPRHWDTGKLTRSASIKEGQVDPLSEPYTTMLLIAPNHIEADTGNLIERETAEEQAAISGKYLCSEGDVVYSKIRPALRKATLAPEACLCSADMYPLRAHNRLDATYLLFYMLADPFSTWAVLESDRVAMPKINRDALADVRMALPPLDEQRAIATRITEDTKKIDRLRYATERSVLLLRERRQALITAAVTGQLDTTRAAA